MDTSKALFRMKLREQKQEKRINSPLVEYNEYDQPVCKVCKLTLKSDSQWAGHQVSQKHHEAIQNLKAAASRKATSGGIRTDLTKELKKPPSATTSKAEFSEIHESKRQKIDGSSVKQPKGILPDGFFDSSTHEEKVPSHTPNSKAAGLVAKPVKGALPEGFFDTPDGSGSSQLFNQNSQLSLITWTSDGSETKPPKGSLPEGFFDNKDADLRARGIQPTKIDVNDVYKEFEKEIQEDLQEVDDRLEEEEIDAADYRAGYDVLEEMELRDQVEMLKKKFVEAKTTTRLQKGQQRPSFMDQESSEESSSGSDEGDDFVVDWRAQHL